ncbi:MAG: WavE lipopolysaccharide synthesis family protein [Chlorobiales bacterium]
MIIHSNEISIVVQGPVAREHNLTARCLLSARKFFPQSEIILSTWKGSNIQGLHFDKVIFSEDPGGVFLSEHKGRKMYSNTNRQIVSTNAGLSLVERKYAIKFRTDMIFTSSNFLRFFFRFNKRASRLNLLERRVIVSSIFTPNPNRLISKPFSPSDWFTFGLANDVKNVWDIPLAPEPDNSLWFKTHPFPEGVREKDSMRYRHEQYIWLSFLRKYVAIPCEHQWDYDEHNRLLHELSLANNVIILHPREIGIKFMKYGIGIGGWAAFYTHSEWLELYQKHCDPEFAVEIDFETKLKRLFASYLERFAFLRNVISFFDYRYRRLTEAWNRENRFRYLFQLLTSKTS